MFQQHRTWGHCPVRFICPEDSGMDVPGVIMRQLMDYYIGKEFRVDQLDKLPTLQRLCDTLTTTEIH
jgi:hypothetical protein